METDRSSSGGIDWGDGDSSGVTAGHDAGGSGAVIELDWYADESGQPSLTRSTLQITSTTHND